MLYVGNAFSLQMVQDCAVEVKSIDAETAKGCIVASLICGKAQFCIGHADTARVAAQSLNEIAGLEEVEFTEEQMFHRVNVNLGSGDVLLVMQVVGGRLPEGCAELPEGVQLQWRMVTVR